MFLEFYQYPGPVPVNKSQFFLPLLEPHVSSLELIVPQSALTEESRQNIWNSPGQYSKTAVGFSVKWRKYTFSYNLNQLIQDIKEAIIYPT